MEKVNNTTLYILRNVLIAVKGENWDLRGSSGGNCSLRGDQRGPSWEEGFKMRPDELDRASMERLLGKALQAEGSDTLRVYGYKRGGRERCIDFFPFLSLSFLKWVNRIL